MTKIMDLPKGYIKSRTKLVESSSHSCSKHLDCLRVR